MGNSSRQSGHPVLKNTNNDTFPIKSDFLAARPSPDVITNSGNSSPGCNPEPGSTSSSMQPEKISTAKRQNKYLQNLSIYIAFKYSATATAHFSPSIAADTIPPAYPAPSPQGYNPLTETCCIVAASRGMRTGDDVRDSTPINIASLVRNPLAKLPNLQNPFCKRFPTKGGNHKSSREGCIPGA